MIAQYYIIETIRTCQRSILIQRVAILNIAKRYSNPALFTLYYTIPDQYLPIVKGFSGSYNRGIFVAFLNQYSWNLQVFQGYLSVNSGLSLSDFPSFF